MALLFSIQLLAQSWGEKMGATAMLLWKDSMSGEGHASKWTYDQGVVLKGMEGLWYKTGDGKYFDYMRRSLDVFVTGKGEIKTYKLEDYNLDNVLCGRILITLYNVTGKEKYYKAAVCYHTATVDNHVPRKAVFGIKNVILVRFGLMDCTWVNRFLKNMQSHFMMMQHLTL